MQRIIFLKMDPDIADNCIRELVRAGFDPECRTAGGPEDLAALLGEGQCDLVLTEYAAPGWSWCLALAALSALAVPVPVMAVARDADARALLECVIEGAADCIRADEIFRLPLSVRQILALRQVSGEPVEREAVHADVRFRRIFDASPDGILHVDDRGRIVLANAMAGNMFHCSSEELSGKPVEDLIPERFREVHVAFRDLAQAKAGPRDSELKLWAKRLDGHEFPAEIAVSPFDIAEGPQMVYVVRDVTERRAREEALQQQAQLVELSHDAIIVGDPAGRILLWNAGAEEMYGWAAAEVIGKVAHEVLETSFPRSINDVNASLDYSGRWDGELIHTCRDGERITVDSRQIQVRGMFGAPVAILRINRDVRQRKQAEAAVIALQRSAAELAMANEELSLRNLAVERSDQMKNAFVASMSHELRTPLNAIIGFSDLLAEQVVGVLSAKQQRFISHIQEGARHLLTLINDILDLSKMESGRLELDCENVEVAAVVAEVLSSVQPMATTKGIHAESAVGRDVTAWVDRLRLRQILYNLIGNAMKFTPEGGVIGVEAEEREGLLMISVVDTGLGIADDEQEAIFREFHQGGVTTKGIKEGTGLGLAITRRLVEAHGASASAWKANLARVPA